MKFGPAKSKQNLSLAEQQAILVAEKRKQEEHRHKQTEAAFGGGQFWDALGSRGTSASPAISTPPAGPTQQDDDDLFAAFNKNTKVDKSSFFPPPLPDSRGSTPANSTQPDLSKPSAWNSGNAASNRKYLAEEEDDPFGLAESKPSTTQMKSAKPSVHDDDDFLGDLGRPVEEFHRAQQHIKLKSKPGQPIELDESSSSDEEPRASPQPAPPRQPPRRADPVTDRTLAQLVDYGFSLEDARRGIQTSAVGANVQTVANWLLDDAHRRSKEQAQGRASPAGSRQPPRQNSRSPANGDPDFARSAAAVGNSLFKTAGSLWKTSQKKVQQAVSEFQQDADPSQPKWMRDAQQAPAQPRKATSTTASTATDEAMMLEAGERQRPVPKSSRPTEPKQSPFPSRESTPGHSRQQSPVPRWQQQSVPPLVANAKSRLNRLNAADDDDSFGAHVSASRRRKPSPQPPIEQPRAEENLLFGSSEPKPNAQRPTPAPARTAPQPSKRPAQPKVQPRPTRQVPPVDASAIQISNKHRTEGSSHFKRGDYASAHASYSSSLRTIPPTHPLMILLLSNRALTSLKTGEPKQALSDADAALKIIGPGNGKDEVIAVTGEAGQEEKREMKDLYGKVLSRKAEAQEQLEKWAEAASTWQACVESGAGGASAIQGRQRCQAALAPKVTAPPKLISKPRPKVSATSSLAPQKESEAVIRMRQANDAAAREDDEKFALSEKVDSRVSAWRDGKRDNLRALLGSLDAVLWEGSGWKKVGLHELVMANKVKISYMKAIAKTHPDKVSSTHGPTITRKVSY